MGLFSQNSTYTLQALVDIARSIGDIAPVLPTGGSFATNAYAAANDAMTAMIAGNSKGSPFNWKFNRMNITPFFINSWQQDYASSTVNLGWLEICYAYNTSSTVYPKPVRAVECKRDVAEVIAYYRESGFYLFPEYPDDPLAQLVYML